MVEEQQAVPVAQWEDDDISFLRREIEALFARTKGTSLRAKEWNDRGHAILDRLASHPCKSGEGADYGDGVGSVHITPEIDAALHRALLASTTPVPDATQTREAELVAALKAQEDAQDARDGCFNCEGEGMWEHCPSCSLTFGRAIDLRRAALGRVSA